jgi:hypothetical protein
MVEGLGEARMIRILALVALAIALLWLTRREPEVWEEAPLFV